MNKKQWITLSITFWILMFLFIGLDRINTCVLDTGNLPLGEYDIWCIVNGEIYEPFIYLFFVLAIAFSICGFFEYKN